MIPVYRIYSIPDRSGIWYTHCINSPKLNSIDGEMVDIGTLEELEQLGYSIPELVDNGQIVKKSEILVEQGEYS